MADEATRKVMLQLAGDDIEEIAVAMQKVIGWGNGAVFEAEHRCGCPGCEQERDDVRAALLSAVAPIVARYTS